jgi:hypothetical protein
MVLLEVIKSLGDIGLNENNDTVANIVRVVSRLDNTNPDNLVAIAAIDAFEKIAKADSGIKDPAVINLLLRISTGPYVKAVQERARQAINTLRFETGKKS